MIRHTTHYDDDSHGRLADSSTAKQGKPRGRLISPWLSYSSNFASDPDSEPALVFSNGSGKRSVTRVTDS